MGAATLATGMAPLAVHAQQGKERSLLQSLPAAAKPPVAETYGSSSAARSGIALGGIGAGSVELRKDGLFYNWSIFNNWPRGGGPAFVMPNLPRNGWEESLLFFVVRYQEEGKDARMKLLSVSKSLTEGAMESIAYYYPWMTAVQHIEYRGRFPFVHMRFTDEEMPLVIEMEAFCPFIPHDVKNSALPGVYFRFNIQSLSDKPIDVMLSASLRNCVGYDTTRKYFTTQTHQHDSHTFFDMSAGGMPTDKPTWGQMGLGVIGEEASWYLGWEHKHPYYERMLEYKRFPNINDTDSRNKIHAPSGEKRASFANARSKDQRCFGSIAVSKQFTEKGQQQQSQFLFCWHFPNQMGYHGAPRTDMHEAATDFQLNITHTKNIGTYYSNFFGDAAAVAAYMAQNQEMLYTRSRQFVEDFYASDLEQYVLDQINSQLNTFITSSILRKDGMLGMREGLTAAQNWGPNNTSDVSLYGSVPIIQLFPELQKSCMVAHRKLQTPEGEINHGLGGDVDFTQNGTWGVYERVDLPGNYIQQVLRDWLWTNDDTYLKEMWPSLKKATTYVLERRDEDKDGMPDMHGIMCSYDNFPMYGLASYIQSQWLCCMALMADAARAMGDKAAEQQYRGILEKGKGLVETHLWNGKYYRLSNDYNGKFGNKGADEGCLTDQLIGQWMAHQCGLGYLFDKQKVHQSLRHIMQMNFLPDVGMRNCSWPQYPVRFPIHESSLWVDQANTPWTGVELAFAGFLMYEGMYAEALRVIKSVDDRYRRAGLYWDHQEFGGHYYRPMSAWSILNGALGLSVQRSTIRFSPQVPKRQFRIFFALPAGTGHYVEEPGRVQLRVLTGELPCTQVILSTAGLKAQPLRVLKNGQLLKARTEESNKGLEVQLPKGERLQAGDVLEVANVS